MIATPLAQGIEAIVGRMGDLAARPDDASTGASPHLVGKTAPDRRVYGVHSGEVGHAAGMWISPDSEVAPQWAVENLGVSAEDLPTLLGEATLAIESARMRLAS